MVITTEIILGLTTEELLQKLIPGLHANFGTNKLHINTINQLLITTFAGIQTLKMVVYGAIPLILIREGNTVHKLIVVAKLARIEARKAGTIKEQNRKQELAYSVKNGMRISRITMMNQL